MDPVTSVHASAPLHNERGGGGDFSRPIRVAIVSDALFPWHKGGKETRYRELLRRLPRQGFDVTVYSMKWWTEPPPGPVRYVAICPRLRLYNGERRSMVQAVIFSIATLQLVFRRFDVIEADQIPVLQVFPLRLVATLKRVKLVVSWHEVWGRDYWCDYLGRLGPVAARIESSAATLPDRLLPGTSAVARRLESMRVEPSRITVLPHAVDRVQLNAVRRSELAPDLLFVGRLLAHKRCDVAIQALAQLRQSNVKVRLGVVGRGPELNRLAELAQELDVDEQVDFLGVIEDHEELWGLMKGASVLVFPSEREGFGLTVAESLALGTPVVCGDHPDNEARHLVDDAVDGEVVTTGDPRAFAAAIQSWIVRRSSADEISSAFWSRHAALDWDVTTATYAAQLSRDVSKRRGTVK